MTPVLSMVNYCQTGQMYLNESVVLELTHDYRQERFAYDYVHCSVDVAVPPGMAIYVHFLSLDISDHANTPDRCVQAAVLPFLCNARVVSVACFLPFQPGRPGFTLLCATNEHALQSWI